MTLQGWRHRSHRTPPFVRGTNPERIGERTGRAGAVSPGFVQRVVIAYAAPRLPSERTRCRRQMITCSASSAIVSSCTTPTACARVAGAAGNAIAPATSCIIRISRSTASSTPNASTICEARDAPTHHAVLIQEELRSATDQTNGQSAAVWRIGTTVAVLGAAAQNFAQASASWRRF